MASSRTWGTAAKGEDGGGGGETVIDVTASMNNRQLLEHRTRKLEGAAPSPLP
jgi:hypothetical protein